MPQYDPCKYTYSSRRNVVYAKNGMACTSVPLGAQVGLEVLKAGGNAMDAAVAMAKSFAVNAPIAVKYSKACIDRGLQMDIDNGIALENELFAMCFATEDQKEGMGAFLEKRKEKHFQNK